MGKAYDVHRQEEIDNAIRSAYEEEKQWTSADNKKCWISLTVNADKGIFKGYFGQSKNRINFMFFLEGLERMILIKLEDKAYIFSLT